jgi:quercetin dioxygenase-like cupin family protein
MNNMGSKNKAYTEIKIQDEIDNGKEKEVNLLFEGKRRKIAQLTLRSGKNLESHSVEEPITIQCVAGNGEIIILDGDKTESIELKSGTFITIESNVLHDVIAKPFVSILLIRFLDEDDN